MANGRPSERLRTHTETHTRSDWSDPASSVTLTCDRRLDLPLLSNAMRGPALSVLSSIPQCEPIGDLRSYGLQDPAASNPEVFLNA
jgi:hypothetical protein